MPAWRPDLPISYLDGSLSVTQRSAAAVFDPEFGPPMARRRSSTVMADYTGRKALTAAQAASLSEFYAVDCAAGALSFTKYDTYSGAVVTFRFTSPPAIQHKSAGAYVADLALLRIA